MIGLTIDLTDRCCSLAGGIGTIQGTVLGVIFLRVVIGGVGKVIDRGAELFEGIVVGFLVVIAVAFNELRGGGLKREYFPGMLGVCAIIGLTLLIAALAFSSFDLEKTPSYPWILTGTAMGAMIVKKVFEMRRAAK